MVQHLLYSHSGCGKSLSIKVSFVLARAMRDASTSVCLRQPQSFPTPLQKSLKRFLVVFWKGVYGRMYIVNDPYGFVQSRVYIANTTHPPTSLVPPPSQGRDYCNPFFSQQTERFRKFQTKAKFYHLALLLVGF